jgi:hypothetical protein
MDRNSGVRRATLLNTWATKRRTRLMAPCPTPLPTGQAVRSDESSDGPGSMSDATTDGPGSAQWRELGRPGAEPTPAENGKWSRRSWWPPYLATASLKWCLIYEEVHCESWQFEVFRVWHHHNTMHQPQPDSSVDLQTQKSTRNVWHIN